MKQEEILNSFEWLKYLLLSLSPDCVDYPTETEDDALIKIVDEYVDKEDIIDTIKEGQQVLTMQPFPWEWITDHVGTYWDKEKKQFIEESQFYKKWLQEVLLKLENEAKRQGKMAKTDGKGKILSESTSFPDVATANKFIKETIRQNKDEIVRWLSDAKVAKRRAFSWEFDESVGYGFNKNGQYFDTIKKVNIVIIKTKESFAVYTSYPLLGKGNNIEREKLNQLHEVANLLLYLSAESVDYSITTEEEVLEDFVNRFDEEDMIETLKEGHQVLAMQTFPWEWVADMRGYYSCNIETRQIIEDPEFYKTWLQAVLLKLEAEARKQGKLS